VDRFIQLLEDGSTARCDPAEVLAAIPGTALAPNERFRFQPIQQAGDARCPLDHAIRYVKRRHTGVATPAQDTKHVVLLERDAERFHDFCHTPPHEIGRVQKTDRGFMRSGAERLPLMNRPLERGLSRHGI
jgi:hypothetical protein